MEKLIVAAVSENRVLAKGKEMLWHMPADLAFFRSVIRDCFLLVGRTSFESPQGREIYANRTNFVVVTRRKEYHAGSGFVANSIEEAFKIAENSGETKLAVLGGGQIYKQAIPFVDTLIITRIHHFFDGDVFFPKIDPEMWEEVKRVEHDRDLENPYAYAFVWYRKK